MGFRARTSAGWLHLRGALRCAALRGRCTGCDARTSAGWLHLRGARWLQLQARHTLDTR
jgi:hypothetical protein